MVLWKQGMQHQNKCNTSFLAAALVFTTTRTRHTIATFAIEQPDGISTVYACNKTCARDLVCPLHSFIYAWNTCSMQVPSCQKWPAVCLHPPFLAAHENQIPCTTKRVLLIHPWWRSLQRFPFPTRKTVTCYRRHASVKLGGGKKKKSAKPSPRSVWWYSRLPALWNQGQHNTGQCTAWIQNWLRMLFSLANRWKYFNVAFFPHQKILI